MSLYIKGLEEIADRYDHFILDIYGVLHDGIRPFPQTLGTLRALQSAGKQVCLLSNSPRMAAGVVAHLQSMGIGRGLYAEILTSGEATHYALKERRDDFHQSCGDQCWFIGNHVVAEVFEGLDIALLDAPDHASFILNSIPGTAPPERARFIAQLQRALARDIPMICSNPDLIVHIGDDLYECAGTFAQIYADMGGRVLYHGKPYAPVYERAHELLRRPEKSRICAVGDSLHTDIAGANGFGIDCILNLAGIHREEITPETLDHIETQPHKPSYLVDGFVW